MVTATLTKFYEAMGGYAQYYCPPTRNSHHTEVLRGSPSGFQVRILATHSDERTDEYTMNCEVTSSCAHIDDLPADAARSVLDWLDAPSLARLRSASSNGKELVDGIAADLLSRHMRECRQRVTRRSTIVPRGKYNGAGGFVATTVPTQPMQLWGGMCCGGPDRRRSLHRHSLAGAWTAASYCGRQVLLVRSSDGAVIGDGPGIHGTEIHLECACDADRQGEDGAEADGADADDDDDPVVLEQEEEARSRGWNLATRAEVACLGCGSPNAPTDAKIIALPEPARGVCACPGRSFILGASGAVYSARWHGTAASRTPSASPWTRWAPTAGERVVEISAVSAHVLMRTAIGRAMAFGDPQEGKLGFDARTAWLGTPRVVDALAAHCVVGVAAGTRHSLFLTNAGECFTAGYNGSGQCGTPDDVSSLRGGAVRRMRLPSSCALLVQVSAGHAHTLLLDHDGRVHACGLNDRGQCGIETLASDNACVLTPTLVGDLPANAVRAVEAGTSLSAFEVDESIVGGGKGSGGGGGGSCGGDGSDGGGGGIARATSGAAGQWAGADESGAGTSVWLAGNVESFNIPGTNYTQPTGLRFLPSCYQWQHLASMRAQFD